MKLLISSTSLPPFYVCLLHSQLPKFRLPYNWVSNHCSTANYRQCSASSAYNCTFQRYNVKFFEVWNVKCSRYERICWRLSKESTLRRPQNDPLNLLKPTGYVMHQQVQHSRIVRSAHTVFICFVFIWEQTATCATYIINWLVFITELKSVYCEVRTGSFK